MIKKSVSMICMWLILFIGVALAQEQKQDLDSDQDVALARVEQKTKNIRNALVNTNGVLSLNEELKEKVTLQEGKKYLFVAAGCAHTNLIWLKVKNKEGKIIDSYMDKSPSTCFIAQKTGEYTVEAKLVNLVAGNSHGSVAIKLVESNCYSYP